MSAERIKKRWSAQVTTDVARDPEHWLEEGRLEVFLFGRSNDEIAALGINAIIFCWRVTDEWELFEGK